MSQVPPGPPPQLAFAWPYAPSSQKVNSPVLSPRQVALQALWVVGIRQREAEGSRPGGLHAARGDPGSQTSYSGLLFLILK